MRLSVTDRCNLRCGYCMPEDHYRWLATDALLDFDELTRVAAAFVALGATRFRLTGGEPLLRPDVAALVPRLREAGAAEITLTTNGVLLAHHAAALRSAGVDRITISLDTLRPERMEAFARRARHADVLAGIGAAADAGFTGLKLNTVVVRGFNEDEIAAIAAFAWARGIEPRFIEYMDVGGATRWRPEMVVSQTEIIAAIAAHEGSPPTPVRGADPHAPAARFACDDGRTFGVIASTTRPFCRDCDRARITADGTFLLCLYAGTGIDLRGPIRSGVTADALREIVADAWRRRVDRGAELRGKLGGARDVLVPLEHLRRDPHQEMHVRGG